MLMNELVPSTAGLPTKCFKKVWKICEVLNVRIAAVYRPAQAQEMTVGTGALFPVLFAPTNFF